MSQSHPTSTSMPEAAQAADLRSPDEMARATSAERIAAYSEDWVTAPRRHDCGERLGAATQAQVRQLLQSGMDEAAIREAALSALAAEEASIVKRHRRNGWLVFGLCLVLGIVAALNASPRDDMPGLLQVGLMGAIGLLFAHGVHMHGLRKRTRLVRSSTARKEVWRSAVATLRTNG